MDVSHLSTNNLLAYKRFPIFTVKLQPGSCRSSLALVCPMPRYSANSFTLSNAFSIKLRCHVSALPFINILLPFAYTPFFALSSFSPAACLPHAFVSPSRDRRFLICGKVLPYELSQHLHLFRSQLLGPILLLLCLFPAGRNLFQTVF